MTSVVHSMVHVSQTLRDFGPVQHYSTLNFESVVGMFWTYFTLCFYLRGPPLFVVVGSLVQSINGPYLIVSELINNINLLKSAIAQLNTINYRTPLHLFIRRIFASKRQALPKEDVINQNNSIRVGHKLILSNDHIAMAYLRRKKAFNFSPIEHVGKIMFNSLFMSPTQLVKLVIPLYYSKINKEQIVDLLLLSFMIH